MKEARFSSILPIHRTLIRCYHSGLEWTWERWQWRGTPHSPKLQHYWNLTIRLFSVISRTLVGGGGYPSAEVQSVYSTAPADWAKQWGFGFKPFFTIQYSKVSTYFSMYHGKFFTLKRQNPLDDKFFCKFIIYIYVYMYVCMYKGLSKKEHLPNIRNGNREFRFQGRK